MARNPCPCWISRGWSGSASRGLDAVLRGLQSRCTATPRAWPARAPASAGLRPPRRHPAGVGLTLTPSGVRRSTSDATWCEARIGWTSRRCRCDRGESSVEQPISWRRGLAVGVRSTSDARVAVMAIINRTPDSFYDKGATFRMAAQWGGALPDRGGPTGSMSVGLRARGPAPVDRRGARPGVAGRARARRSDVVSPSTPPSRRRGAALAAGASVVNDSSGLGPAGGRRGRRDRRGGRDTHRRAARVRRAAPATPMWSPRSGRFLRERDGSRRTAASHSSAWSSTPATTSTRTPSTRSSSLVGSGELGRSAPPLLVALSNKDFVGEP